jgi:hypothetical protein
VLAELRLRVPDAASGFSATNQHDLVLFSRRFVELGLHHREMGERVRMVTTEPRRPVGTAIVRITTG